jgi:dihydrofolate reductase
MLSLIVAMDKNQLIGNRNQLPWHLSEDLKRFKAITMGKPVIMGRKTFESIGRPLPGRRNIIISRNPVFRIKGCETARNLIHAIELTAESDEAVIIGGRQIYQEALTLVDRMYLTLIEYEFDGDAWFPPFNEVEWNLIASETHECRSDDISFTYRFKVLDRKKNNALC